MLDHRRLDKSIKPQILDQGMLERLHSFQTSCCTWRLLVSLKNGARNEASRCQIHQYNITAGATHSWRQTEPRLEDNAKVLVLLMQSSTCLSQKSVHMRPTSKVAQCFELDTRSFNSSLIAWWQHLYCSCKAEKSFGKLNGSTSSRSVNELLFTIARSKDNIIWLKDP